LLFPTLPVKSSDEYSQLTQLFIDTLCIVYLVYSDGKKGEVILSARGNVFTSLMSISEMGCIAATRAEPLAQCHANVIITQGSSISRYRKSLILLPCICTYSIIYYLNKYVLRLACCPCQYP